MQYLLMLYADETGWSNMSKSEQEQGMAAYMAYGEALKAAALCRVRTGCSQSQPRPRCALVNGKSQVLDGPYVDSKEQLGGYYLIDVPDLDAALSWAARCPGAGHGVVEVRPIWSMPEASRARNLQHATA